MASSHKDNVLESSENFLPLTGDPPDELKGEVGKLLVGIDEGLEEDEGIIDVLCGTFGEDIPLSEYLVDLVLPELVDKQVALLLVGRLEEAVLDVVLPFLDELHLVVDVVAEVDVVLHHVLKVLGNDGHAHVILVVDDDVENLSRQDLALHQQHDVGLVQLQLLLDPPVHQLLVLLS
jgi:hypothetical protein